MHILAIDTSGKSAALAILNDDMVLHEILFNVERHHSEILVPALDVLCETTGISIREIDLFVCTTGPGSFTGLRIGLSTIKGLALTVGKPVVGVSSLKSLACNATPSSLALCPMLDARKDQVYAAVYEKEPSGVIRTLVPDALFSRDHLWQQIAGDTLFLGDGAIRYRQEIEATFPGACSFAEPFNQQIRGSVVGFLGYQKFMTTGADDALSITPRYLRLSEAEERVSLANTPHEPDKY